MEGGGKGGGGGNEDGTNTECGGGCGERAGEEGGCAVGRRMFQYAFVRTLFTCMRRAAGGQNRPVGGARPAGSPAPFMAVRGV